MENAGKRGWKFGNKLDYIFLWPCCHCVVWLTICLVGRWKSQFLLLNQVIGVLNGQSICLDMQN